MFAWILLLVWLHAREFAMDTSVIVTTIVPCFLQRKVRITYDEVNLHKIFNKNTTTRATFMSLSRSIPVENLKVAL